MFRIIIRGNYRLSSMHYFSGTELHVVSWAIYEDRSWNCLLGLARMLSRSLLDIGPLAHPCGADFLGASFQSVVWLLACVQTHVELGTRRVLEIVLLLRVLLKTSELRKTVLDRIVVPPSILFSWYKSTGSRDSILFAVTKPVNTSVPRCLSLL